MDGNYDALNNEVSDMEVLELFEEKPKIPC